LVTLKFFFFSSKKKLHNAVLIGTVQLLLPCKCRDRGEEDFKSVFGSVVAGAFQIAFLAEIYANDVFLFFKNHF